jgi:hypothetical protein
MKIAKDLNGKWVIVLTSTQGNAEIFTGTHIMFNELTGEPDANGWFWIIMI